MNNPGSDLITITGTNPSIQLVPSQFNARSTAPDGSLIVYNSYTGALSSFPSGLADRVVGSLKRSGFRGPVEGLTKYLYDRGFLVRRGTDEISRFRFIYGQQQYRSDELELILLASENCNFRCEYCYETFPRETMEPWVQRAIVKLITNRAPRLNRLKIDWFGGEPLLGLEAVRAISTAASAVSADNGISFSSGMTTNGYLLDSDLFTELVSYGVVGYQISIDGEQHDHDHNRHLIDGSGTFDTIVRNVLSFRRVDANFSVTIRVNFGPSTATRIVDLLDVLAPLKGDPRFSLRFYPIGRWGGSKDAELEVCGKSGEQVRQELDILARKMGHNPESRLPYLQHRTGCTVCYATRPFNYLIGADGKVMKCTVALDTKDYNIVGRITEDGRLDLDVDKLTAWVRPYYEEDNTCKACFFLPVCQGASCPLPRVERAGRPCPPEKQQISSTLRNVWSARRGSANVVPL